jgi:hypothetical protein
MPEDELQQLRLESCCCKGAAGCAPEGNGGTVMKEFEVYRGDDYDLVAVIRARTYEEAMWKARKLGYGKEFRLVEVER